MKFMWHRLICKNRINLRLLDNICRSASLCAQNNKHETSSPHRLFLGASIATLLAYKLYDYKKNLAFAEQEASDTKAGVAREGLPYYSLQDVSQHCNKDTRIWVTYKEGVYDITDFVEGHPGGDQILLAAGSSVEPFWMLYAVHNNPHVWEILETLRIGNVTKEDAGKLTENMSDPYSTDPKRHPVLHPASVKPFNAETPPFLLVQQFITPNELFYVRNHLPVPKVDPETYELEIEIEGKNKTLSLTLDELKKLPRHTITATIMCAGNRRSEMTKVKPVKGLSWGAAAVGNATWTGVRLRDVLALAGVDEDAAFKHVQFEGLDFDPTGKTYGASIPFWKAASKRGDVILAFEMNGVPIPRDHGFPVRVIVPGTVGARNVKWLARIIVSEKESDSHWQQNDYKGFSPSTDWDTVDFTKSPAIQELPVISAICQPSEGQTVQTDDGHILVKGYAWSGGGQKIVRVDVTLDEGDTWHVANLDHQDTAEPPQHWSWTLWSARIPVKPGTKTVQIWAKAVDSCYNTQPESFKNIWNLRGVLSNAYHRVTVKLQ
ncbi:sulfite oxidase, mitochondrial [Tribolium castaneum]|uniref:sulfite oxidase n=1 Tax=Tribolium castaneum TaxID=7070 RepID=D6WC52_TRICA|nr:PREDICTED: probable sulfite oxidase, mitochondrial [Tribolium castaneum]XP_008190440.1 PREDICTED: probable sulfite oxidase, mitochondrial [Tribolium castaneum]XP_971620.2 PREDICTED: probable sulfite oxidase, mitochondrial [Tribolium castaneum]EEZ97850.1 putative sulfite oxidase, mitochondrial-like Protein [Tribolium castaneum]|eukprot:XP_008190439.1 PREDICTED: probable sulfite oxidase, mitochondrial [Tribolium castaneum]